MGGSKEGELLALGARLAYTSVLGMKRALLKWMLRSLLTTLHRSFTRFETG